MTRRAIMVWGCSSGAGKSLLTTALCRWAARRGAKVAPFKAQNMSNNARVVVGMHGRYGEIGAAQYFQALAANVEPSVDMNPVLLKPERETTSQVIVHGKVAPGLARLPWRERSVQLAQAARESFLRLRGQYDLIIMEGAGSPAEINLAEQDYVNLDAARWAAATGEFASLLIADIDRGGAFAHAYGTWALLPDDLKPTLAGVVLNKFRGDPGLLNPGPQQLQAMTGVPVAALLPMRRDHGLPEEDGVFDQTPATMPMPLQTGSPSASPSVRTVAIIAYPQVSNLDEFQPLRQVPGLRLVWARSVADLHGADWIVLPGSKQVSGDLAWLRQQGLDRMLRLYAAAGRPLLGVCGGLQMLGQTLSDPDGVDGDSGAWQGLGLLSLATRYQAPKRVGRVHGRFQGLTGAWAGLNGTSVAGYEIRQGQTTAIDRETTKAVFASDDGHPLGWSAGSVLATSVHGLFESPAVLRALFGVSARSLEDSFDGLAEFVDAHFTPDLLARLTGC